MSESSSGGGITWGGALTLLFIGLKLSNNIDWSWWWVLSPLWIAFAIAVLFMLLAGFIGLVAVIVDWRRRRSAKRWRDLADE